MDTLLSVILRAQNAQQSLARQLGLLLDQLPDLTPDFEILIVDDGSSDQTEEVARELLVEYPQLRLIRHAWPLGPAGSLQSGLQQARGDIVIALDAGAPISARDLRRMWELRDQTEIVIARPPSRAPAPRAGLLDRLVGWGRALAQSPSCADETIGMQMIRRQAFQAAEPGRESTSTLRGAVSRTDRPASSVSPHAAADILATLRKNAR